MSLLGGIPTAVELLARAFWGKPTVWRYALAVAAVACASATRIGLSDGLGDASPFQTFVLAVLVVSLAGGLGPGLFATLLSGIVVAHLYLSPLPQLDADGTRDTIRLILYGLEGLLVAMAGEALHRALGRERQPTRGGGSPERIPDSWTVRPASAPPAFVEGLTEREVEIIRLLASGLRNDEIAARCFVSRSTVKTHLAHAYAKLGARSRTEAVARCLELGILDRPTIAPEVSPATERG